MIMRKLQAFIVGLLVVLFVGCAESVNAAIYQFPDGLALDKFGGDIVQTVSLADIVDRNDVWMI
jgi:hypothetical protein